MRNRASTTLNSIARMMSAFTAAAEASAAVRNHRKPSDRALRTLGIDPDRFPKSETF